MPGVATAAIVDGGFSFAFVRVGCGAQVLVGRVDWVPDGGQGGCEETRLENSDRPSVYENPK